MNASKITNAKKAFIIRQAEDETPVAEIYRKRGINSAMFSYCKIKYAWPVPSELKQLRELEQEPALLKKIVAALSLDKEMLQDTKSASPKTGPEKDAV